MFATFKATNIDIVRMQIVDVGCVNLEAGVEKSRKAFSRRQPLANVLRCLRLSCKPATFKTPAKHVQT